MPTDLKALVERVESGAGSDRELDALICVALQWIGPRRPQGLHDGTIQNLRVAEDPSWPDEPWEDLDFEDALGEPWTETTPAVVNSMDAVLSLIEAKLPGRARDLLQEALEDMGTRGWDSNIPELPQITRAALSTALRAIQESRK